jgi:hypothetical protein
MVRNSATHFRIAAAWPAEMLDNNVATLLARLCLLNYITGATWSAS